jgi:hypothetical protein
MDGRPKFLQLRIENGQRLRRTSHLKIEDCNGRIDETAHSFDRVEKDTQQAKPTLHFPPFSTLASHLLNVTQL